MWYILNIFAFLMILLGEINYRICAYNIRILFVDLQWVIHRIHVGKVLSKVSTFYIKFDGLYCGIMSSDLVECC